MYSWKKKNGNEWSQTNGEKSKEIKKNKINYELSAASHNKDWCGCLPRSVFDIFMGFQYHILICERRMVNVIAKLLANNVSPVSHSHSHSIVVSGIFIFSKTSLHCRNAIHFPFFPFSIWLARKTFTLPKSVVSANSNYINCPNVIYILYWIDSAFNPCSPGFLHSVYDESIDEFSEHFIIVYQKL